MNGRIAVPYNGSEEFIMKRLCDYGTEANFDLPTFDDYLNDENALEEKHFNQDNERFWEIIKQQYNEYRTWFTADEESRRFLAPILGAGYLYNLEPFLIFPNFEPIISTHKAEQFSVNECLVALGYGARKLAISESDLINFIRELPSVCDALGLNADDILYNPSNIGYSPTFGLRIIDYGLNI